MEVEKTKTQISSYGNFVNILSKPGEQILSEMTPHKIEALHMAVGISSEAGELEDAIKKYSIYNKPVDRVNVVEELGDIEFFLEGLRQKFGISRDETLRHNVEKLSVRYKGLVYSNEAAHNRADKNGQ